jgi:hypothetical protein
MLLSVEVLQSGESLGCGCSSTPRKAPGPREGVLSDSTRAAFSDAARWRRGGTGRTP